MKINARDLHGLPEEKGDDSKINNLIPQQFIQSCTIYPNTQILHLEYPKSQIFTKNGYTYNASG